MLNLIRKWQPSAPSCRKWMQTSSSACTENVLSHFLRSKSSLQHVVHGRRACLRGEGTITLGTGNGEVLSADFFYFFFSFPPLHPTISVPCKRRSGVATLPLLGLFFGIALIHHCASNKAIKSTTRSSLRSLCDGNRCSRGLLNLGLDGLKTLPSYSLLIQVS